MMPVPFTTEEAPEAIAALMAMSDINRFSHVVMDGSLRARRWDFSGQAAHPPLARN
jgi:hypothetical protein